MSYETYALVRDMVTARELQPILMKSVIKSEGDDSGMKPASEREKLRGDAPISIPAR